jgi:hypothetical protein
MNGISFLKSKGDVLTNSGKHYLKAYLQKSSGVSIVSNSGDPGSGLTYKQGQNSTGSTTFIRY